MNKAETNVINPWVKIYVIVVVFTEICLVFVKFVRQNQQFG